MNHCLTCRRIGTRAGWMLGNLVLTGRGLAHRCLSFGSPGIHRDALCEIASRMEDDLVRGCKALQDGDAQPVVRADADVHLVRVAVAHHVDGPSTVVGFPSET